MIDLMSNRSLLFISLLGTLLFVVDLFILENGICSNSGWCSTYLHELISVSASYLIFFVATLILSSVVHLLKMELPESLFVFTPLWVALSVVFAYLFGQGHGGWITSSPEPQGVFFLMMIPYLFISLAIVFYTRFVLRDKC